MFRFILLLVVVGLFLRYLFFTQHVRVYRERTYLTRMKWPLAAYILSKFHSQWRSVFFEAVFSMLAKMAKANGSMTQHELEALDEFMRDQLNLSPKQVEEAFDIIRNVKQSKYTFEDYAYGYYRMFGRNRVMLENMVDLLLAVACADGRYTEEEDRLVNTAVQIFQFTYEDFARIRARHLHAEEYREKKGERAWESNKNYDSTHHRGRKERGHQRKTRKSTAPPPDPLGRAYEILGCKQSDPPETIKKAYRRLVKEYHPDKVSKAGTPKEFLTFCTMRFNEVQQAYESIKEARGIS